MNLKKALTKKLKEDTEFDGVKYFKGMKLIAGSSCPRCKQFFPVSSQVTYCNNCGYRSKRLKNWEIRKKAKRLKRAQYEER